VLEAVGRPDLKPVFADERPGDVPRLWVDPAKLRAATSFRPRTRPAQGLAETVDYYKALYAASPDCLSRIQTRNWEVA
jgi:nucleoside-diphosphate-sugar epimerase